MIIEIPIKQRNVKFYHNLLLLIRAYHAARINVSRNAFLNSRSEEKKTFSLTFIPGKTNQKVIYRGLYSYPQLLRFITLFSNNVFLLLRHVERVCKSF